MSRKKKSKLKVVKKTKKSKLKVVKKTRTPRKPKSRRSQAKYPALEKKYNLLSRQELIDMDYIDKLNDKEKAWLNKFIEEEVNASFNHPNPLNKTKKQKRVCYTKNNARNRDLLTRNKIIGNVENIMTVKEISQLNPEEMMIWAEEKELEEAQNLNNGFNSAEKSENSAQKKH